MDEQSGPAERPPAGHLTISSFAGGSVQQVEAGLVDADVARLVDELAAGILERLARVPFPLGSFVARLVFVERDAVHVRHLSFAGQRWTMHGEDASRPDLVIRWQGIAHAIRCENGDEHVQSAVATRVCQLEGSQEAQDAFAFALAASSDDPTALVFTLRGLSDRKLERTLRTFDLGALVRGATEIGAEVSRHMGNGREFGRRIVVQLEVPYRGHTHVTQTVADGTSTIVYDESVLPPTLTCRFANALDFVRVCTREKTPMELVVSGDVEVEGDLSMLANVDLLRW